MDEGLVFKSNLPSRKEGLDFQQKLFWHSEQFYRILDHECCRLCEDRMFGLDLLRGESLGAEDVAAEHHAEVGGAHPVLLRPLRHAVQQEQQVLE